MNKQKKQYQLNFHYLPAKITLKEILEQNYWHYLKNMKEQKKTHEH